MVRSPLALRLGLLLAVVAALAGCKREAADPKTALVDAVRATFAGTYAFEVTVDADREALAPLGDQAAAQIAFLLNGVKVQGQKAENGSAVTLEVVSIEALALRTIGQESFYLRLAIDDFAALAGQPAPTLEQVAPELETADVPQEFRAAVEALFTGDWAGMEGVTPEAMQELLGGATSMPPQASEAEAAALDAFGGDLPGFFERYVSVAADERRDATRILQVDLAARELLTSLLGALEDSGVLGQFGPDADLEQDLADVPAAISGRVELVDGRVHELTVDLAELARGFGAEVEGAIDLKIGFTQHGEVAPVTAPDGAVTLTPEQFLDGWTALQAETAGGGAAG